MQAAIAGCYRGPLTQLLVKTTDVGLDTEHVVQPL